MPYDEGGKITWSPKPFTAGYNVEVFARHYDALQEYRYGKHQERADLSNVPEEVLEIIYHAAQAEYRKRRTPAA